MNLKKYKHIYKINKPHAFRLVRKKSSNEMRILNNYIKKWHYLNVDNIMQKAKLLEVSNNKIQKTISQLNEDLLVFEELKIISKAHVFQREIKCKITTINLLINKINQYYFLLELSKNMDIQNDI